MARQALEEGAFMVNDVWRWGSMDARGGARPNAPVVFDAPFRDSRTKARRAGLRRCGSSTSSLFNERTRLPWARGIRRDRGGGPWYRIRKNHPPNLEILRRLGGISRSFNFPWWWAFRANRSSGVFWEANITQPLPPRRGARNLGRPSVGRRAQGADVLRVHDVSATARGVALGKPLTNLSLGV
ncbi:MAG: hypothetical protein IPN90_14035 [Elusimicrobia bacterium]|nr:hypothetical protein [Elusimicrobiota bacterium]